MQYEFDAFTLSPSQRALRRSGERIALTPRVFDLLLILVEKAGEVATKEELLDSVWAETNVEEGNINRTVSTLRKHLGKQADGSDFIETVPKQGYRFIANIDIVDDGRARSAVQGIAESALTDVADHDSADRSNAGSPLQGGKGRSQKSHPSAAFAAVALVAAGSIALLAWRFYLPTGNSVIATPTSAEPVRLTNTAQNEQVASWNKDGKIGFVRWKDEKTAESFFMNADGSEQAKQTAIPDLRLGVWSPDGKMVVFWKQNDAGAAAYLARADGSGETKLSFSPENIAWSPDSKRIAYQSSANSSTNLRSYELFVYSVESKKNFQLTQNGSFDGDPGWSPDGRKLAFVSDRDGNYEIYLMDDKGADIRRLTNNPGHDSFPKFSPDGTQILFNSNIDRETTDIYLMNADGSNITRLTDWKSNELTRSGWSPDGTRIAFNSDRDGNDEIYVMNVEPLKPKPVAGDDAANLQTPSYSPDGRFIAYSAEFEDKTGEIRIRDLEGGKDRVLLKTSSAANYPRWSPDGGWIAFHQEVEGKWDVFKVRPDGSELTNLTNGPASDSVPTWSPDGTSLYFRSNRNGDTAISEIFRMSADGSNQELLPIRKGLLGWCSVSPAGSEIVYASDRDNNPERLFDIYVSNLDGEERLVAARFGNDTQPSYSGDGSRIVFVASSDGNPEIYVVNSDGSNMRRLTRDPAIDTNPAFSPDGSRIIFSSNRTGRYAIYEMQIP